MLRVLTWNLMHGRSAPGSGRDLFEAFAALLAGWDWNVALLQEVPPWWPGGVAAVVGADQRMVLTSRNFLLPLRRALAIRWPDLVKSNGGGCNAILVRGFAAKEHRVQRLSWCPERRWAHAVRLGNGVWVGNVHTGSYAAQGRAAAATLLEWADGAPVVLGGDFNVAPLTLDGFDSAGGNGVDRVFVRGALAPEGSPEVLERGSLSDHAPVLVSVIDLRS